MAAGDSDLDRPGGLSLIAIQEFVRMDMSMTVSFRFQYVLRHWRFQASCMLYHNLTQYYYYGRAFLEGSAIFAAVHNVCHNLKQNM